MQRRSNQKMLEGFMVHYAKKEFLFQSKMLWLAAVSESLTPCSDFFHDTLPKGEG